MMSCLRKRSVLILGGVIWFVLISGVAQGKEKSKPKGGVREELKVANAYLKAGKTKQGIARLASIVRDYPDDSATPKIKKLLREYGVGEEVGVELNDRKILRERLKITEKSLLDMGENTLKGLRGTYKGIKPFFKQKHLQILLFDNEAVYRAEGGSVTSAGNFGSVKQDFKASRTTGKIAFFYPMRQPTPSDRMTHMKSLLTHESTHYLNSLHFAGFLPTVFDEGLAVYMAANLNKTAYQHYRITEKQKTESAARHGLNVISKVEDFLKFLENSRGLGRGDATIERWYGLCYSVVDTLVNEKINRRKGSMGKLLKRMETLSLTASRGPDGEPRAKAPRTPSSKALLELVVKDFFEADLATFHRALVKRVTTKYKRR